MHPSSGHLLSDVIILLTRRGRGEMLASRIMTAMRRTTVNASADDLRTLEAEAARRGVPLTVVLRDAVEDKARAIREGRRPHVGVARSSDGRRASELTAEPVADETR